MSGRRACFGRLRRVVFQRVDDQVGNEVGVLLGCGGLERVAGLEVARERREGEGGGAAVGEQEVEGAQRDGAGAAVACAVVEQAADRREGGRYGMGGARRSASG